MITLCFSKHLTEKLQTLLSVAYQANDFRLYRIVQGLLWLAEVRCVGEIARWNGVEVHVTLAAEHVSFGLDEAGFITAVP